MTNWTGKTRKRLHRLSLKWITRFIRFFSRFLPYRLGVWTGGILGFMAFYVLPRERKRALQHLTLVFQDKGDAWIRSTARRSFMHLGKGLFEVMLMDRGRLARIIDFRGEEKLQEVNAKGRGIVYVTGHIGNWELMAGAVALKYPVSVVAAPVEPEEVNDMIVELRAGMGVRTILRGKPGASRELIRVFKENRMLGILIDQDTDVDGAFVDFMGRPAWTPTAAASMAIKFDAPVLFGYIWRGGNNRHTVTIEGPLELIRTGDDEKDIIANTSMLTKKIESCILDNPEQWVWMHRRWRRQP
ncbi:MAG TPA: lysophospholipid acyltransferase family protein [Nitrospirota bacterium]|nr:lysophospholipid acyltransferase family protein [Nitrospirota bacterium]